MRFKKSTRYALYAAMAMARAGEEDQVTVTGTAARYSINVAVLAKIFQQLVRSGLAVSTRGVNGGYRLTRRPSALTVLDVIQAFEPPRATERCLLADENEPDCDEHGMCRLRRLFDEVDEMTRCTYASVTLETLVDNRPAQDLELRVVK